MAYNGSGTFARLYSWATDKTNSVAVTAARMDGEHDGFATGLSTAICKDGQSTTTAVIPFAAGISVSDGAVGTPSVSFISDTDTGLYRSGTNELALVVAGTAVMVIGTATISCAVALSLAAPLPIVQGGTGVSTTNSVRVNNSANISIANNVNTVLTFDTEDHDTNAMHSTISNTSRLTAVVAGTYIITGDVTFASGAAGNRTAAIKKNALSYLGINGRVTTATGVETVNVVTVAQLAATDYVELEVNQVSGGALNVTTVAGKSPVFSMVRVGA